MENTSEQTVVNMKYLLVIFVLMGILLTIGGFYYYSWEEKSITNTKQEEIKAIAEMKIGQITQWHQERVGDGLVYSQSPFFSHGINQWLGDRSNKLLEKEIVNYLHIIKKSYDYENIFLCSANGELLLSFNPVENKLDLYTSSKIRTAVKSNQIVFTDFYYCLTHKRIHYDIIAPVVGIDHSPIAALVFRVDPNDYLYPFMQTWPTPGKSSETLIVRKDGDSVLYVNELRLKNNTALQLRVPMTDTKVPEIQAVMGFKGIFEGNDYRGVKVLAYVAPIPGTPWFMVAKVDQQEAYSELRSKAVYLTIITLFFVVLVGFGFLMIFNARQKSIYLKLLNKEKLLRANQEEYKTTLYSIGDAVITTNMNGIIQQMNPVAEQLTGWHETVVKGIQIDRVLQIINEETRKAVGNPVNRILHNGLPIGLDNNTLLISKSGTEIPITESGAPVKNEYGEITGVVFVFRDQTEEHKKMKELVEAKENFLAIFKNNAAAIAIIEPDTTISMVNEAYCRMSGYTEAEVVGMSWTRQIPSDDLERLKAYNRLRLSNPVDAPDKYEFKFYKKDGEVRYALISISMIQNTQKVIASFIDVTESKRANEALQKSEERFRNTLDNMMEGCQIIGYDWRYLYINDAVTKHGRTEKKEMLGRTMMEVYPGIEKTEMFSALQRCVNERITEHLVNKFDYPDHSYAWFELSIQAVPEGVFILSFDITERKEAEHNLIESEMNFRNLFENSTVGKSMTGIDGSLNVNKAFCDMVGYSKEELQTKKWMDITHPDDIATNVEIVQSLLKGEIAQTRFEKRFIHKNGNIVWVDVSSYLQRNIKNGQEFMITSVIDITDRKEAELKIWQLKEELEQRVLERTSQLQATNTELEAFSYSVSHDLRAPLRHIGGYVELLRKHFPDSLPERGKHYLQTIVESVSQMGMLIDDLLQFSRTGRQELQRATNEMNKVVEEVMNSNKQDWAKRNIQWIIPDLPQVFGDFNLLKMVWINLISNAVKFTRKIDIAIIEIGFREEKNEFIFYVRDNGVGFNMQYVDKLFGVFQRLHSTQEYEGTGIGLANVRRIILRHGGRTWAEGELNVGATFYFSLPKKQGG